MSFCLVSIKPSTLSYQLLNIHMQQFWGEKNAAIFVEDMLMVIILHVQQMQVVTHCTHWWSCQTKQSDLQLEQFLVPLMTFSIILAIYIHQ